MIRILLTFSPKCSTDHLFLLTQSFAFCVIAHDPKTNQIITKASGQLKEENASITTSSSQSLISIDPKQQNILIHIHKGELLLIRLDEFGKERQHCEAQKIPIHELEILSLAFLHTKSAATNNEHTNSQNIDIAMDNLNEATNTNNNAMNIDSNEQQSAKSKASKAIKSGFNKLKSTKINGKLKNLRHRKRSNSNEIMQEEKAWNETKNRALVCILYQDYRKGRHLKTYYLNFDVFELQKGPWDTLMVEEGCNKLIALKPPLYGVLFIGQYSIAYRNGDNCQRVQVTDGDLCCFDEILLKNRTSSNNLNEQHIVDGARWLIGMFAFVCVFRFTCARI